MEGRIMQVVRTFLICFLVVVLMDAAPAEISPMCCFTVLSNGSANYTLSHMQCKTSSWSKNNTPIKDENDGIDETFVHNYGENWILLDRKYSDIEIKCMEVDTVQCTGPCDSGEDHAVAEGHGKEGGRTGDGVLDTKSKVLIGVFVTIIIVVSIIVVSIMWKKGCIRNFCGDVANREANHANDYVQAEDQEDQQESIM